MKFIVGNGGWVTKGSKLVGPGTLCEGSEWAAMLPPADAVALDVDCAMLMWLRYPKLRKRLLRRLGPIQEQMFNRIVSEFSNEALEAMWGLKPAPSKPKAKALGFAEQLNRALANKAA